MVSPRTRRLRTDQKVLNALQKDSSIVTFTAPPMQADAPDSYVVTFHGRGLARDTTGQVIVQDRHEVFIKLGANYPRGTPELAWRTPIFHPNISAGGAVCLGGYGTHWTPSLMLDELCTMLWDMIRYANFDVESPYNREAAHWAKTQSQYQLPVDTRPIRDRLASEQPVAGAPPVVPVAVPIPTAANAANATNATNATNPASAPASDQPDVLFLADEVVEAEIVNDSSGDDDILFID